MPNCRDAKLLQGLVRQARQDRLIYLVLAECCLILPKAKAPQPDHNVHNGAQISGGDHHPPDWSGCLGCRWGSSGAEARGGFTQPARVRSPLAGFIGICEVWAWPRKS